MSKRIRVHQRKDTKSVTPTNSTVSAQEVFQSRPFEAQSDLKDASQPQPDLKTALMHAERYGHRCTQMHAAEPSVPPTGIQPKMVMGQSLQCQRIPTQVVQTASSNPPTSQRHRGIVNRGGRFSDLDKAKLANQVGHHMPQNAYNRDVTKQSISRNNGPALGMSTVDHALTRTYRGKGNRTNKIDGDFLNPRQALAVDIRDIRKNFGSKYNSGLREVLNYAKTLPEFQKPRSIRQLRINWSSQ